MTIASFTNVRRYRLGTFEAPNLRAAFLWLVFPLVFGWLAFAFLDSVRNFAPQEIRLSADGEYDPYLDDFVVFYTAGALAGDGHGGSLYDPAQIRVAQADELGVPDDSIIQLPFYNPPAFALPLAGLAMLPMAAAAVVWTAFQMAGLLASFGALWWKERATSSPGLAVVLLLGLVSSMPFHETILHGQVSLLMLGGLTAFWFGAFDRRSDSLAVLALTVLAIKPQLAILPLAYLLLTHRWRALTLAAAVQLSLAIAASVLVGPLAHWRWLTLLLHATSWEDQNGIWIHAMFGWNAFIRALVGEHHQVLRAVLSLALATVTLIACLIPIRRIGRSARQPEAFAMLVFASVLISPHLFAQDLILPVGPIVLLVLRRGSSERNVWLAFGALGWALTFVHFDFLIGAPEETGINFVTLWLALGMFLSYRMLKRPLPMATETRPVSRTKPLLALPVQLLLAATLAVVLFATVPGLAGQRLAKAIEYSYSSSKGPTYRIVIIGLSNE